jgi:hypothetical protein
MDFREVAGGGEASHEGQLGRAELLRRAVMLGGAVAAGELVLFGVPRLTLSAPSTASASQDRRIFRFMLQLEELQSAFYEKALSEATLRGEELQFAQLVGGQERAHLAYLRDQLGGAKVEPESFEFGASTTSPARFLSAAVGIEELGLEAYNGQAPNLTSTALRRAGRIISVEARHVAWARSLKGELPAPVASDSSLSQSQVLSRVKGLGYVD